MSSTKRSAARQGIEEPTDRSGTTRYRGTAYDERARRKLRGPWTPHLAEARAWRVDAQARLQAGTLSAVTGPTIREAAEQFMAGIESGAIRTRKTGRRYKRSGIRAYELAFRTRVLPALGATRMARVTRTDVQLWVDSLSATGLAPNTIRNAVTPLQALYGWARSRGLVHINPCTDLELPTGEEARDRIAAPAEAAALIAAVPAKDQAALGLAVYAGLRMGELLALSWEVIDLDARTLRVTRAWDDKAREFSTAKSKAGQDRVVPIVDRLATLLADHAVLMDHPAEGLLFPGAWDSTRPLSGEGLRRRCADSWREPGLEPLGFHEGRHTFASLMIAAGVNVKALSTYMGHANIKITLDRYGHLLPGNEAEARALLDAYLDRAGG